MKPIKLRTKIEAVGLGLLLIALSIVGVFGVTRTITSSSDTYETLIRNSNGKYWAATGANLNIGMVTI
jgi:hypothetical protein